MGQHLRSIYGATLESLKFEGLIHLSEEVASEMIGIKQGDSIDIEMIDNAIKTLYKQNYFEDIWVEEVSEGSIVFHFKEKPTIANVSFEGIGDNDKEEVITFLNVKKGEVYDKDKADLSAAQISKYYEAKGYFDTVVEHKTEKLNENAISINFMINRGEEIIITSVKLSGAKELEYSDVMPTIANKEAEILPWMWGFNDGKLRLGDLENDGNRIKDIYMQNGYLDAIISTPFLKAYLDSYTANLTYTISEGRQYKVGIVSINIPEGLISQEELKTDMALDEGDVFNINRLRRDMKRIEIKVADLGYAYVRIIPDINKKTEEGLVDINFRVIPGQKVYINDVRISGNSRTIDRVVRRDIFLASGDLYSRTDFTDSQSALKRSSYFEDVKIKENRISQDKIDLIIEVTEASTGSIGGGIGYGSTDGILLSLNLSDSNIFGSGINAGVNIERSDKELSGSLSLTNPRVFDSIYSLSGSLYRRNYEDTYNTTTTTGFSITVGRSFGRNWRGSVSYQLESKEYSDFIESIYEELYPDIIKSSIIPSVSYKSTDDFYLPRKGIDFKSSLEFAGVGGDAEFLKSVTKLNYFYGLKDSIDYDLILRYKTQAHYLQDNGLIPLDEYIKMGGVSTVRGYESRSLYPIWQDGTLSSGNPNYVYGGNMMFVNTIEASFPLIERLNMRGAIFFDYGMTGLDNLDIKRGGTGAVLEWVSPLGPISLIFAKALFEEAGDSTSSFEFTMGRKF